MKATLSVVNVAALPDKGERLRTQVKELEDALESMSLTAASQPGNSLTVPYGLHLMIFKDATHGF